jgi:hypothetical protein
MIMTIIMIMMISVFCCRGPVPHVLVPVEACTHRTQADVEGTVMMMMMMMMIIIIIIIIMRMTIIMIMMISVFCFVVAPYRMPFYQLKPATTPNVSIPESLLVFID